MWLPTQFYERVPQSWFLLGLLFVSNGVYLGFENTMSFIYTGVGALCVVWSSAILVKRSRFRNKPMRIIREEQPQAATADQEEPADASTPQAS